MSGGYSIVPQIKSWFGIDTSETNSLNIEGELTSHVDYINTYTGNLSANGLQSLSPSIVYNRHISTTEEIKGKKLIKDLYNKFFKSELTDLDKSFFLNEHLAKGNFKFSSIYSGNHSISKVRGSINQTSFSNSEEFTDKGNETWDEGEEFIDDNKNGLWDQGEEFTDKGNGLWDNGQDDWLKDNIESESINYSSIKNQEIAKDINRYVDNVAIYDAKYDKIEKIHNSINNVSKKYTETKHLSSNTEAVISTIEYDLNKIDAKNISLDDKNYAIPSYKKIKSGISISSLVIILLLFIIYTYKNKESRAKLSFGAFFSIFLLLTLIFKINSQSSQGSNTYQDISYIYIVKPSDEKYTDLPNGVFDAGIDVDCGLDGICPNDPNYISADNDGTERNNYLESEAFEDNNDNGIWDEDEKFTDSNNNNKFDSIEIYADLGNRQWDEGEEFIDDNKNGIWDNGETIAKINLENLIGSIDKTSFQEAFLDYKKEGESNGKLYAENIIITKEFNRNNLNSLRAHSSIILDILNESDEKKSGDYFIINDEDANANINGYFIGYVNATGNYYKKTETDKLKSKDILKEQKNILIENNYFSNYIQAAAKDILDIDDFQLKDLNEEFVAQIFINISESSNNPNFIINYKKELSNLDSIQNDNGIIAGTILQMNPGETSDIIFTDDKAYIVFLHSKNLNTSTLDLEKERETLKSKTYTFSKHFEAQRNNLKVDDWRNKSSRSVPNALGYSDNINDIYFNLGNFKAAFSFNTN